MIDRKAEFCDDRDDRLEDIDCERLSSFLRRCRSRIPSESEFLGHFQRQRARVGKPLTQDEVAEACGISRQWYVLMENDRSVRVSGKALLRIAETLRMTPAERVTLFRLAVPELRSVSLTQQTKRTVDAIAQFRPLMRELWSASTESEALTVARGFAQAEFGSHAVVTFTRLADGCWDSAVSGDEPERFEAFRAVLREYCVANAGDYHDTHGVTMLPSEVLTHSEFGAAGGPGLSTAMVRIQSRRGLVVTLMLVDYQLREFTAREQTQLRTLAGIVSLALSAVSWTGAGQ
ncbi:MAG: helix-turn-helix transcriptional regulator [Candidatus Eremiobacteraeota bacterium]|nr:helix-turn-helix transcriptional regulator [Candidatus Eremiobacteraeota bacterium]